MTYQISRGLPAALLSLGMLVLLGGCVEEPFSILCTSGNAMCEDEPISHDGSDGGMDQLNGIMVTNTSGGVEVGSLRWAVSLIMPNDTVRFAPHLGGQTIVLDDAVTSTRPMTIEGPADGITISGGGQVRVFHLSHPGTTTLRNLTITGGLEETGSGGGIYSSGALTLEHTTVTGNVAPSAGAMIVRNLTLVNSTVSGNTSTSTLQDYPAIMGDGTHTYVSSTIAGHTSGGANTTGRMVLNNTILSDNGGMNCTAGSFTYEGTNLSDDGTCGGTSEVLIGDAQLAPLADNGGPNMTRAFAPSSPAFDGGTSCAVVVDQRYVPRDGSCDIGAFELTDFTTVKVAVAASQTVDKADGWVVVTGTITCSRDESFDLAVDVAQQQKAGRYPVLVHATAETPVACTTTATPWTIVVVPAAGEFRNGAADVSVRTVNTPGWLTPAASARQVKLFWRHK